MYRQIGYGVGIFLSVGMSLPYVFIQLLWVLLPHINSQSIPGVCIGLITALAVPLRFPLPPRNQSTQQSKSKSDFLLWLLLGLFIGALFIVIACIGTLVVMALGSLVAGTFFGIIWGAAVFIALSSEIHDKQETAQGERLCNSN